MRRVKKKTAKKIDSSLLTTIITASVMVLAHIAVLLLIYWSYQYYAIYPSIFGSAVAIVLLILMIIDIVYFVGLNHSDMVLKIISGVLAFFILIGGTFGSYYVYKVNHVVNSILNTDSSHETFQGVFVSYNGTKNNPTTIESLAGKKIGMLVETSNGITYCAEQELSDRKIDYGRVDYKSNTEMLTALIDGDVDAIAITSGYKGIIEADDNSPFTRYLDDFVDIASFERELAVNTNKVQKNINTEPFNILLIGWSRTDIGSTVGLADAIIVATINPQTYTVSMMSIARDSFVPISCYGGEYDKINSGRSTSRACFIQTVEDFTGLTMDYYMEMDYLGLVQVVNAIGGIVINNPVTFTLDGIYVEAGTYLADGQQVLQFCRERHHMPNGDFDRQQHQKEVIIAIAKKFIEAGDVSLALYAMEEAADYMSTDLTLNQLTSIFNLLLNTKNYTGLDTFDLVDFHTLRMTGYGGILYYSYSMRLPLWVYLIYQGSYDESIGHIKEVMGQYSSVSQDKNFEYSIFDPYVRADFYSLEYPNKYVYEPDPMPAYWADLIGMSQTEALAWASANGVKLSVDIISSSSSDYNKDYEGLVTAQSTRYGQLVSDYPSGTITVMGPSQIDESKQVPDFIEHSYSKAITWAKKYNIPYSIDFNTDVEGKVGDVVEQTPKAGTAIEACDKLKIVVKAGTSTIKFNANGMNVNVPGNITVKTGDSAVSFSNPSQTTVESDGKTYVFDGWYTAASGGDKVTASNEVSGDTTVYAHWTEKSSTPTQPDTPTDPSGGDNTGGGDSGGTSGGDSGGTSGGDSGGDSGGSSGGDSGGTSGGDSGGTTDPSTDSSANSNGGGDTTTPASETPQ